MMATVKTQLVIDGKNNTKRAFDEVNGQLNTMNKQLATAGRAIVAAFSVSALTGAIRGIANAADSYNLMNARLKLATGSQEEFNTAQTELRKIATATQTPLESLATLYGRISRPLKEAGRSQADILKVTEAVATSFRVSGASAQEAENGVIQFAQALGSGALRGDEFNSVAEQAPRLMLALADSIGVPVGALKEMAAQGLLTASVVTDALVGQLDTLRTEAESLPETVGGAMTALSDSINQAVGSTNLQPLIDSLNELNTVVSDPSTVQGLASLTGALTRIGATGLGSLADFGLVGDQLGLLAARFTGAATELDKIDNEIKEIEKVLSGTGLADMFLGMFFTEEELKAKLDVLRSARTQIVEEQTGMNAELDFLADVAAAAAEAAQQADIDQRTKYIGELKTLQDKLVADAKKGAKALVSAEKAANRDLEKVRADRLKIEERYREALAGMNDSGEASYGAAQSLKVGARQALQAGNVEGAQAQAQAALKMLQDLQAAGENTYGFAGFIGELQEIELAANDIEQSRAEQKIASIKQEMASLAEQAEKLKNAPISFKLDEASLAGVKSQIEALAAQLGQQLVIPVQVTGGDFSQPYTLQDPGPAPQGFATGGYISGPGTGTSDSVPAYLSNGEYVIRAAAVRKLGKRHLDMLNQGIPIPRFADGGLFGAVSSMQSASPKNLGSLDISLGGETIQVFANSSQADQLRMAAKKFGRTHRS
ncbi:MAG TPA: phage tail protein [Pseudomonas sp.]|nr:phage tail protein [Pseudomonas sp.]